MKCETKIKHHNIKFQYINSYTTCDGRYVSVGAIEPKFYQ